MFPFIQIQCTQSGTIHFRELFTLGIHACSLRYEFLGGSSADVFPELILLYHLSVVAT